MRRPSRSSNRRNSKEPYADQEPRQREGLISPETRSFIYGVGVGMLAMVLFPQIKDGLKPVAVGAAKGAKGVTDKLQEMVSGIREGIEDIVAEAKFENLKKALEQEIMRDSVEEAVDNVAEKVVEDIIL